MEGAALLESFPYLGRSLDDETDRRDWPVNFGSGAYILRYRVDDDGVVVILRVWHSREQRD
jgi:plasmid stabilization system protein ParE